MTIAKRSFIRIISFLLAALLICFGFTLTARASADHTQYLLETRYKYAFQEFVSAVGEIDTALQKAGYAATPPMIASTCAEVFGKATAAQAALGSLPFNEYQLQNIAAFISKAGDYCFSLAKSSFAADPVTGIGYSEEQNANLVKLSEIASKLHSSLREVEQELTGGVISIAELQQNQSKINEAAEAVDPASVGESFKLIESEFPDIPSLVYDGPFSEHITAKSPRWIENDADVSDADAKRVLSEFTGIDGWTFSERREGALPCYLFSFEDATALVTVKGGKVLQMRNARAVNSASLAVDAAVKSAKTFLEEHGYGPVKESYFTQNDNVLLINFAYLQDDVICYPDLVKVSVALDDGGIVGFESTGFIMNHTEAREIPNASIDESTARTVISETLTIISHDMAIIPTSGENEAYVHEFICESRDARHYVVCVNALTGHQEKILILLEEENGTLAI
jgi:germination protein YpeB